MVGLFFFIRSISAPSQVVPGAHAPHPLPLPLGMPLRTYPIRRAKWQKLAIISTFLDFCPLKNANFPLNAHNKNISSAAAVSIQGNLKILYSAIELHITFFVQQIYLFHSNKGMFNFQRPVSIA